MKREKTPAGPGRSRDRSKPASDRNRGGRPAAGKPAAERGRSDRSRHGSAGRPDRETRADRNVKTEREPRVEREGIVGGRNPVAELIKSGRPVDKLIVQNGAGGSMGKIVSMAKDAGIHIEYADKAALDRIYGSGSHQGAVAKTSEYEYADFDELLERLAAKEGDALVVLLDGIEDPHNLGAVIRTCECAGADAVVITKNRSCGLTATAAKTSAGAVEYVPCARVTNMARAVEELQQAGFWAFCADMDVERLWDREMKGKLALIIGNEGKGVSRLVREKCDFTVSIPMAGRIDSLNASNAAAILIYETVRQRG